MAGGPARICRVLSRRYRKFRDEHRSIFSWHGREDVGRNGGKISEGSSADRGTSSRRNELVSVLAGVAATFGVVLYVLDESVRAAEIPIDVPRQPWIFKGVLKSLDHAALRRGWTVYRTICHTCHSVRFVRFMDLDGVSHTTEEVKALAAEFEVKDGPDDEGNYYERPGKPSDAVPGPYPNEEAARVANFGAFPPDLSYIIPSKKKGPDYIFSLLTGWMDPPAGVELGDTQYFNAYFPGNAMSMNQMLQDGVIDYDDGTPATLSQMAKDVTEFLTWTAYQEHDTRKLMTLKAMGIVIVILAALVHINRVNFSQLRTKRIAYVPKRGC